MNAIDVTNWFELAATQMNAIGHTPNNRKFARNVDELIEGLPKKIICQDYTLVMDEPYGLINSPGDGTYQDVPTTTFMILRKVAVNDWVNEEVVFDMAKRIGLKILAKALKEKNDFYTDRIDGVMKHLDTGSFRYRREIIKGHNLVGVWCQFSFLKDASTDLVYNPMDWTI